MKNIKVPVMPGDILEFKVKNTTVRGKIFAITVMEDEITASIYDHDVFTKNCGKCIVSNPCKKCEFWDESKNDCTLANAVPLETEEIKMAEIGNKYRTVRKHWGDEQEA